MTKKDRSTAKEKIFQFHASKETRRSRDTRPAKLLGTRASDIHSHEKNMANGSMENGCCITTDGLAEKFGLEKALKFAKRLYVHGGNISNWNRIKRKTTPSSADEVSA